jgi:hypothetical protein
VNGSIIVLSLTKFGALRLGSSHTRLQVPSKHNHHDGSSTSTQKHRLSGKFGLLPSNTPLLYADIEYVMLEADHKPSLQPNAEKSDAI